MDNRSFWNYRYARCPQIGSGPGSRGYAAARKNQIIRRTMQQRNLRSILDIGCGDLCWLDDEITQNYFYIGCDIAEIIVERNTSVRRTSPSSQFFVHDIVSKPLSVTADLVVCFDVLIHQIKRAEFEAALRNILDAINKFGLISYLTPPVDGVFPAMPIPCNESPETLDLDRDLARMIADRPKDLPRGQTAFHGSLPEIINSFSRQLIVEPIGRYREHTIYEIGQVSGSSY